MGNSKKSKSIIWIIVGLIVLIILIGIISSNNSKSKQNSIDLIENASVELESEIQNKPVNGADASDGKVHLWLLNKEVNNEKCYPFLDPDEECNTFKIRIQNESGRDILAANFMSWNGWIGDEGVRAHGADGADKIKTNGTTEVNVYFITKIGQKITEIVYEYGFSNEVVLSIEDN